MKKKATCQVEFEFEWRDEDNKNFFADESHFAELYLDSIVSHEIDGADVTCLKVEDVE